MGLENPLHIAFLLIMLLLVFGAKRLPEMGRSLGSGMRGFKDSLSGEAHEHEQQHEHDNVAAISAQPPAAPVAGTVPAAGTMPAPSAEPAAQGAASAAARAAGERVPVA